jgi:hypothetical protein
MTAASLRESMRDPVSKGRATAIDFAGTGGQKTWIGTVTVPPSSVTGGHSRERRIIEGAPV